jgi:hypothetical protein
MPDDYLLQQRDEMRKKLAQTEEELKSLKIRSKMPFPEEANRSLQRQIAKVQDDRREMGSAKKMSRNIQTDGCLRSGHCRQVRRQPCPAMARAATWSGARLPIARCKRCGRKKAAAGRMKIFRSAFWAFVFSHPQAAGGSVFAPSSPPY